MKDLKAEFEQIYSLSIRRGEDSATVWEWINETYSKQLHKPDVSGSLPLVLQVMTEPHHYWDDFEKGNINDLLDLVRHITKRRWRIVSITQSGNDR